MTFQSILKMLLIAAAILIVLAVVTFCILFYDAIYTRLIPPVSPTESVPIDITKAGSTASTLIRVRYNRIYDEFGFYLEFYVPEDLGKYSPAYDKKWEQLAEFVGEPLFPAGGVVRRTGVEIPVRLTVNRVEDGRQIPFHNQVYYTKGLYSGGFGRFARRIRVLYMQPGYYQVQLENLTAITTLPEGVPVFFVVLPAGPK